MKTISAVESRVTDAQLPASIRSFGLPAGTGSAGDAPAAGTDSGAPDRDVIHGEAGTISSIGRRPVMRALNSSGPRFQFRESRPTRMLFERVRGPVDRNPDGDSFARGAKSDEIQGKHIGRSGNSENGSR